MGVDCAGVTGLAVDGGLAVSRVPACCLSFCLESFCDTLQGPISLVAAGAPCCCDAGEDPHAGNQREKDDERSHMMSHF